MSARCSRSCWPARSSLTAGSACSSPSSSSPRWRTSFFAPPQIPRRLMPAAIALGTTTFTMSALPGTPAIQNAIPMPFFGTTPFAAPGLGIIAAIVMFGFGMWWLGRAERSARAKGEGYGDAAPAAGGAEHAAEDLVVRERATTASTFDPPEATHGRPSDGRPADRARGSAADHRRRGQSRDVVLRSAAHGRVFSRPTRTGAQPRSPRSAACGRW